MDIRTLTPSDYPLWDSFVRESPEGTVFQTSEWVTAVQSVFGHQHEILAVMKDDTVVCGCVLYKKTRYHVDALLTPPMMPYNGILFSPNSGAPRREEKTHHDLLELIIPEIEKRGNYVSLYLSPEMGDTRPFQWRDWDVTPNYTYMNSLLNLESGWNALNETARRKIRKAQYEGLTIAESVDVQTLLQLQEESYRRTGLTPAVPNDQYTELIMKLLPGGRVRFFAAEDPSGQVTSARAIVVFGSKAYYWISGSRSIPQKENGSTYLLWEIFRRLAESGVETFDFIGANTPSVTLFKRAFGGSLTVYYHAEHYSSRTIRTIIDFNNLLHERRRRV